LSKKIKDIEKQDYSTTGISIPVENGLKLSKPLFACNGLKKKTCFVSIIHGFSSKQKSFMSIYRWQCFQHISGKKNSNKCIDMDI